MSWIERAFRAHSDRIFLEEVDGRSYTFSELRRRIEAQADALRRLGVKPGDRVLAQVEKSPEALVLYFATLWMGGVYLPLNPAYTPTECEHFIRDAEPRLLVTSRSRLSALSQVVQQNGGSAVIYTLEADGTGSLPREGEPFETPDAHACHDSTPAAILYTSGTTGKSKGALLTHGNLRTNAESLMSLWGFTPQDVLIHALPIFHVHGLFVAVNTALLSGARMIFLSRFDPAEILTLFPRATALMGVPTFYTRLLQSPGLNAQSAQSMRVFISGSAPLLPETHREFQVRTGHSILERYGMTECLMISSNPLDGDRIPGTVGFALPGVSIRVVAPVSGAALPAGEIGSVEVKGPNVFSGYWRNPEKTAQEFRSDGFFITGDLGKLDPHGRLTLQGRSRELIISGGLNIYPKEIENELQSIPGILESAVIGVPHPDFGEAVTAVVVRTPSSEVKTLNEEEILTRLSERLARFKVPKQVIFVDTLPRNAMGKLQKNALQDQYRTLYSTERLSDSK